MDFLRRPQPPRVGWVLLAIGALAMAFALWSDKRWADDHQTALQTEQDRVAAQRAAQTPPPPKEPTFAEQRWRQAQPELQRPWFAALRAVESATTNPVFLLAMSIEPASGLIKLDAEAPTFDHAMAYVQVLDEGNTLQPAMIVSHEQAMDPSGGRGAVKFSVVTHWNAP
ncbi:MAG: hypothetical protein ABI702_11480 [Burkholderiales bacterium]